MASTSASLWINQLYRMLNNINVLIHWCRCRHATGTSLDLSLFREIEINRFREELDLKDDSWPASSIHKPDKFKPINWVR